MDGLQNPQGLGCNMRLHDQDDSTLLTSWTKENFRILRQLKLCNDQCLSQLLEKNATVHPGALSLDHIYETEGTGTSTSEGEREQSE